MPTAREVRESNELEALIAAAPEELQDDIRAGELEVLPGQRGKPVVRRADNKRIVKGSGRPLRANDPAHVGTVTAYKRSNSYREAMETLIPMFPTADARKSFEGMIDLMWEAAEGSPQQVECMHCGKKSAWAFKKDGALLFKMIELLSGKARETKDINVEGSQLTQILERRVVDVVVHGVDRNNVSAKRAALSAEVDQVVDLEVTFDDPDGRTGDVPSGLHAPDRAEVDPGG